MKVYREILKKSAHVDFRFERVSETNLAKLKIVFPVPRFHPRRKSIADYPLAPLKLEELINAKVYQLTKKHLFIIDESVYRASFVKAFIKKNKINPIILKSIESTIKTKPFLDDLVNKYGLLKKQKLTLVMIGGGLLLNIGAYLAERASANLILLPTTVIAMADGSGGKVRVNFISNNRAYKHFYKSFYEPNAIFLDERFLDSLPEKQIAIGLVEIIKHGLFQSQKLYRFLLQSGRSLYSDKWKLKKAILWAASLKRVCVTMDIEENENGSRRILRGGHDFSDRLEEDFKLQIPHGIAVAIGIMRQLKMEKNNHLLRKARKLFKILRINYTLEEFEKWKAHDAHMITPITNRTLRIARNI